MKWSCLKGKKGKEEERTKEGSSNSANVVDGDSDGGDGDGDMLSFSSGPDHFTYSWILDSACSYHISPYRDWFDNYRSVNCGFVLVGNDTSCKVIGIGTIKIKLSCNGPHEAFVLETGVTFSFRI